MLNTIWDDVNVNEGVIFQSVREIRHLFGDLVVVLNHPRKGYQWVGPLTSCEANNAQTPRTALPLTPEQDSPSHKSKRVWYLSGLLLLGSVITLLWMKWQPLSNTTTLVIMPINNHLDNQAQQGLAGDVSSRLQHLLSKSLADIEVTTFPTNSVPVSDDNNHASHVSWQLSTTYYGDVHDYVVIYALQHQQQTLQGVIFAHSLQQALQDLVNVAHNNIQATSAGAVELSPTTYQDADFAQAMIAYQTDWHTAISHLQTYLQQHPHNARAHLYLSRLYIWNNNQQNAFEVITAGLNSQNLQQDIKAELLLNQAMIYQHTEPQSALSSIEQALPLTELADSWLTRAKLEVLRADIYYQQKQQVPALRAYLRAQSFFEQLQSPLNVAAIKLKLAELYSASQQPDMAKQVFLEAKSMIQQHDISFLYAELMEFELHHQDLTD